MKKFFLSILAVVYLGTCMGATIHLHYCMDKLVAWGLGIEKIEKKSCPYCGMKKTTKDKHCGKESKDCCNDEQKIVKLENDQKISEASSLLSQISTEAFTPVLSDFTFKYVSLLTESYSPIHAPPQTGDASLCVLNCVFRL